MPCRSFRRSRPPQLNNQWCCCHHTHQKRSSTPRRRAAVPSNDRLLVPSQKTWRRGQRTRKCLPCAATKHMRPPGSWWRYQAGQGRAPRCGCCAGPAAGTGTIHPRGHVRCAHPNGHVPWRARTVAPERTNQSQRQGPGGWRLSYGRSAGHRRVRGAWDRERDESTRQLLTVHVRGHARVESWRRKGERGGGSGGNARGWEKKERKDVSTVVIVTHILAASAAAGGLGQVECLVWLGARMPTR